MVDGITPTKCFTQTPMGLKPISEEEFDKLNSENKKKIKNGEQMKEEAKKKDIAIMSKQNCENCGESLSKSEIEHGDSWCEDCNLPERSVVL